MVPRGIVGLDAERVARPTGEPAEGVAGERDRRDLAPAQEDVVAGDTDIVEGRAPKGRNGGRGRSGDKEAGRGRAVASSIVGLHAEAIARSAAESVEAVLGGRRGCDLGPVQEEVVAGNGNIVGRGSPREGDCGRRCRSDRQAAWVARCSSVWTGTCRDDERRLCGSVAGCIVSVDAEGVGRLTG